MADEGSLNSVELATELTVAWLGNQNNRVASEEVPAFLRAMHQTLNDLSAGGSSGTVTSSSDRTEAEHRPAVSVRKSLASCDHIVSMIDGKPYKTLRRHLAGHGLSPEQYRERYKLRKLLQERRHVGVGHHSMLRDLAKLSRQSARDQAHETSAGIRPLM